MRNELNPNNLNEDSIRESDKKWFEEYVENIFEINPN